MIPFINFSLFSLKIRDIHRKGRLNFLWNDPDNHNKGDVGY